MNIALVLLVMGLLIGIEFLGLGRRVLPVRALFWVIVFGCALWAVLADPRGTIMLGAVGGCVFASIYLLSLWRLDEVTR